MPVYPDSDDSDGEDPFSVLCGVTSLTMDIASDAILTPDSTPSDIKTIIDHGFDVCDVEEVNCVEGYVFNGIPLPPQTNSNRKLSDKVYNMAELIVNGKYLDAVKLNSTFFRACFTPSLDLTAPKQLNLLPKPVQEITSLIYKTLNKSITKLNDVLTFHLLSIALFNLYLQQNYTGPQLEAYQIGLALLPIYNSTKTYAECTSINFNNALTSNTLSVSGDLITPVVCDIFFFHLSRSISLSLTPRPLVTDEDHSEAMLAKRSASKVVIQSKQTLEYGAHHHSDTSETPDVINYALLQTLKTAYRNASRHVLKHLHLLIFDGTPPPPYNESLWMEARRVLVHLIYDNVNGVIPQLDKSNDKELKDSDILKLVRTQIATLKQERQSKQFKPSKINATISLEVGLLLQSFDQLQQGKPFISLAQEFSGLAWEITGAEGKRTKFQGEGKVQIVLVGESYAENKDEEIADVVDETDALSLDTTAAAAAAAVVLPPAPQGTLANGLSPNPIDEPLTNPSWTSPDPNGDRPQDGTIVDASGGRISSTLPSSSVKIYMHDYDNPLHEFIQYADPKLNQQRDLTFLDQSILIGLCLDVKNSNPSDGLVSEEMGGFLERVIRQSANKGNTKADRLNLKAGGGGVSAGKTVHENDSGEVVDWMIFSTALLIRSWLECESTHKRERAVLQIQALADQHTTRLTFTQSTYAAAEGEQSQPVQVRLLNLHNIIFPPRWAMQRDLAERYAKLGIITSAAEIFESLQLWDEVIECYTAAGKKTLAETLIRKRLETNETPRMWAALGDITSNPEDYEKSWTLSNGRYARARAAHGRMEFDLGNYQSAFTMLREALVVKPLTPSAWFLLGTVSMRLKEWKVALESFSNVVSQEPEESDAWANVAAIHMHNKNSGSAYPAINEALKYGRHNWRVWINKVYVCMDLMKFDEAVQGCTELIDMKFRMGTKGLEIPDLDDKVLKSLVLASMSGLKAAEDKLEIDGNNAAYIATVDSCKRTVARVETLLIKVTTVCKTEAWIWEVYGQWLVSNLRDDGEVCECYMKCQRALVAKSDWWKNEFTVSKVCEVAGIVCELNVSGTFESDGGDDEDAEGRKEEKRKRLSGVRLNLNSIYSKLMREFEFVEAGKRPEGMKVVEGWILRIEEKVKGV